MGNNLPTTQTEMTSEPLELSEDHNPLATKTEMASEPVERQLEGTRKTNLDKVLDDIGQFGRFQTRQMNLDKALDEIGQFGRFQICTLFLLSFSIFYAAIAALSYVFTAGDLHHRCFVPECEDKHGSYAAEWLSFAIPYKKGKISKCYRYKPIETQLNNTCIPDSFDKFNIIRCHEWIYETQELTILNHWHITCNENQWKLALVGTINNVGQLIGFPIAGYLSDRIGRKFTLMVSIVSTSAIGHVRPVAWNYEAFMCFEFFIAMFCGGIYNSAFVLGVELVNPKARVVISALISSFYALGIVFLGTGAMLVQNWQILHAIYIPGVVCILYYWFLPESVRWLAIKGRDQEVEAILLRAAKYNRVQLSEEVRLKSEIIPLQSQDHEKPEVKARSNLQALKKVLTSKKLMMRFLNCSFCWITISFVYIGLSLSAVSVGDNKYTSFIYVALIEMPAYVITPYLANHLGRKCPLSCALLLAGFCCITFSFVPADLTKIRLTMFLLGKFAITVSYTIVFVFTIELFPTELRNTFLGNCTMMGGVGSITAPQTPLLRNIFDSLPFFLFGVISIASGLLILLLPETLNTILPDTVEEAKIIGKS